MRAWIAAVLLAAALLGCHDSRETRRPAAAPRPVAGAADSLAAAGEALYRREAYDSACATWRLALARAESARDEAAASNLMASIALASYKLGDLPEARRLGEAALSRGAHAGAGFDESRALNALGLIALDQDRNLDAAQLFERAAAAARRTGDERALAKAAGNLGLVYTYFGQLDRARAGHRTLRQAAHRLQDARLEANGLANEAMVDIWEGDPAPAIARLDTARVLYRHVDYASGEQNALDQLATAYELTGEYGRAFAALDSALALANAKGLKARAAQALGLIAQLHMRVGDYRRSARSYDQADSLMLHANADGDRGEVLRGSAEAQLRLGDLAAALRDAQAAVALNRAGAESLAVIDDELLLARIERQAGHAAASETHLRAARDLAGRTGTRGARVAVALTEARLADATRDGARVLRTLRRAAPDLIPGDYQTTWELEALAARAYARTGALDSATAAGRRSIAAIEHLRSRIGSEMLRTTFSVDRADVYGDLALALLRQGRLTDAFAVADGARSRALIEHLEQAHGDPALTEGTAQGEALLRQIEALVEQLKQSRGGARRERGELPDSGAVVLEARLAAARAQYESVATQAAAAHPLRAALLGTARPGIAAVQRALLPGEALVEYLLTADSVLVFVVHPDNVRVVRAPLSGPALVQRARLVREVWSSPRMDWTMALPAARALYRDLVRPVETAGALEGARRLLIVPHGVLAQLPFAALQDGSGRFLVQRWDVAELPLAAALPVLRSAPSGAGAATTVLAPFPAELPATAREADAVRGAMPGVTVLSGSAATETALRQALTGGGLVHVASHALLNPSSPMFSRLDLARPPAGSPLENDGRLELHEILGLRVRSPLVYLSGCETGAGTEWQDDPVRGTGDLTLAQSILAAGARGVVSTLWRIDDEGAAAFAARFYRAFRGSSATEALASAQRSMMADRRFGSPYYWAAYLFVGDARVRGPQDRPLASVR